MAKMSKTLIKIDPKTDNDDYADDNNNAFTGLNVNMALDCPCFK